MSDRALLVAGAGAVAVLLLAGYLASKKLGLTAPNAFNPLSADNFVYSGVNQIGSTLSGNKDWSLGVRLWELANPSQAAEDERIAAPVGVAKPALSLPSFYTPEQSPFGFGA